MSDRVKRAPEAEFEVSEELRAKEADPAAIFPFNPPSSSIRRAGSLRLDDDGR